MSKKQREPSFKDWQCPGCGAKYESPIPIPEVVCQRVYGHKSKATVSMKPVGS